MDALIGRKLGMTRVFDEDGTVAPVTVLEAGPCAVVRVNDLGAGRKSVQIGFGTRKEKRTSKAVAGHVKEAGLEGVPGVLREFPLAQDAEEPSPGDELKADIFEEGDLVKVTGTSKGRGFQGVVKRYGFAGGPATHGNTRYRRPGSLGPGTDPSRVIKGKKLPGQMGAATRTELGLRIVRVDTERNLLYVRGAIPGPKSGLVVIRKQEGRSRYA